MRDGSRGKFPNLNEANLAKLSWSRKQIRAILRIQSVLEVVSPANDFAWNPPNVLPSQLGKETGHIDAFARRYLTALYMRASSDIRPPVPFRYVVWAMHSQRQVDLLRISADYWENRRLTWSEAKRIGTPYWLNDPEALVSKTWRIHLLPIIDDHFRVAPSHRTDWSERIPRDRARPHPLFAVLLCAWQKVDGTRAVETGEWAQ